VAESVDIGDMVVLGTVYRSLKSGPDGHM
jgi:hypothetical protein